MRARKKKHTADRIAVCKDLLIENPKEYKGKWNTAFGNESPVNADLGCGKGAFITSLAEQNPNTNFIGIEKNPDILVLALEKAKKIGLKNIRFICDSADLLDEFFSPFEISLLYINFPDPWPRNKNRKRRLTFKGFLEKYKQVLIIGGAIHFKTDNQKLFEFSLNEFCEFGLKLKNITFDLHNSDFEGNVMTEYEKRFCEEGKPIYRFEAMFD